MSYLGKADLVEDPSFEDTFSNYIAWPAVDEPQAESADKTWDKKDQGEVKRFPVFCLPNGGAFGGHVGVFFHANAEVRCVSQRRKRPGEDAVALLGPVNATYLGGCVCVCRTCETLLRGRCDTVCLREKGRLS